LLEERTGFFLLPVLRDRVVEDLAALLAEGLRDVLELREPGGEDVRVAMVINLSHSHTSHRDHTMRVAHKRGHHARGIASAKNYFRPYLGTADILLAGPSQGAGRYLR
jgi:hypothetical protein